MILKIFTQPNCPRCPAAKRLAKEIEKIDQLKVEYWQVTTADGLAEASFYGILSTPGVVLCDDEGGKLKSWQGEAPTKGRVLLELKKRGIRT